jgi:aromatic ring-opening dioxygenase LigB subunit
MPLEAAYFLPHPPLAIPYIGRAQEARIEKTIAAMNEVSRRIAAHRPEIVLFISPHSAYYSDWIYLAAGNKAQGDFSSFGVPKLQFELRYDADFRDALVREAEEHAVSAGPVSRFAQELDHGIMVPLCYIEKNLPSSKFRAVSIGGSGLESEELVSFGACIARLCDAVQERVVLVVSGDLSHKLTEDGPYGYDPAGPAFDRLFGEIVELNELMRFASIDQRLREDAAECGLSGFVMCAGALEEVKRLQRTNFSSELLSLEGPYGVGYGVAAFEKEGSGYV